MLFKFRHPETTGLAGSRAQPHVGGAPFVASLKTKFHYTDKITNFSKQNKFTEKDVI